MNWKLIGIAAALNVIISLFLTVVYLPLTIIGPIIGGFIASYFSSGYEDYEIMDFKDGAVVGAVSGLIGGLILTLLFISFGSLNPVLEVFTGSNTLILGYATLQFTTISSFILGLIGGVLGVIVKSD